MPRLVNVFAIPWKAALRPLKVKLGRATIVPRKRALRTVPTTANARPLACAIATNFLVAPIVPPRLAPPNAISMVLAIKN
jgi:hypothetical protein